MTSWRTLRLFVVWLLFATPAQAAPPEEDLPISPRPIVPETGLTSEATPNSGLSLDDAINRLVHANYDLRVKHQDIGEARADELTASLLNAPAIFLSGHQLPYGRYSPQRPGTPQYEISPVYNLDYSGKRRSRMRESRWETREIEARYQNAVRLEIDRLYDAYVDVLETRERVCAGQIELQQLAEFATMSRQGQKADVDRIWVQRFKVEGDLQEAKVESRQRMRFFAVLLAIPPQKGDSLEIGGSLEDRAPLPPPIEELVRLALQSRPDLAAQRLGSEHDRAILQVTRAERFDDAAVFYSPYELQNNAPQGLRSSSGWGGGALISLPILDRNQGVIARAQINVTQGQIEVQGLERMAVNDVRQAWRNYTASRQVVEQYEREGLPPARRVFEEVYRQYADGEEGIDALLESWQDYRDMVRQYREAMVRHRRSMLKLNTAVGQRLLP